MKNQEDFFQPTALQHFISELNHAGKSTYSGTTFQIPVRLQDNLYAWVEVLTQQAGTSRNKIVNQLIEVAIEATLESVPKDRRVMLRDLWNARMEQIYTTSEIEEGERGDV